MKKMTFLSAALAGLLVTGTAVRFLAEDPALPPPGASVGHGDVATLKTAFDLWRSAYEQHGGSPEVLKLSVGYSKALSGRFTRGRGKMELNLLDGQLGFAVAGLENGDYDLWFVDDGTGPENTVQPDPDDTLLRVGTLRVQSGSGKLTARLTRQQLAGFTMDSVVLTEAGKTPIESVVLTGSPDLMQKLYYSRQLWTLAGLGDLPQDSEPRSAAFDFLLPKPALADRGPAGLSDLSRVLGAQVALGRQLFHQETFEGNGRTCGTCHRQDNNFTIDPNYIAKLPPNDPLFVAENDPVLASLENKDLLRKYGLILTNVDGFGQAEVFRSVPHTLALATSTVSENTSPSPPYTPGEFEADDVFQGATGWGGDGAPGAGTLREFATGAVTQHFPKTLNRCAKGVDAANRPECQNRPADFRLPTPQQLDAIEAYMLSLGRSKDYPVWKLTFSDPLAQAGKVLFDTKENPCADGSAQSGGPVPPPTCKDGSTPVQGETANCNGCHQHAGARSSTTFANPTRNTGVEEFKINPARLVVPDMPYDGGFGIETSLCGADGVSCYGDKRFNTTPLIEAADTAPYFHNNSVSTLEEAIAAYNSDAFNQSPGMLTSKLHDRRVKLDSSQVTAVGLFLRSINVLENIRQSNRLDNQAAQLTDSSNARELIRLASAESGDAIHVLKGGKLLSGNYAEALAKLEAANRLERLAQVSPARALRNSLLQQAITRKQEAKALIASCDDGAPRPATVGSSPDGFVYTCPELDEL